MFGVLLPPEAGFAAFLAPKEFTNGAGGQRPPTPSVNIYIYIYILYYIILYYIYIIVHYIILYYISYYLILYMAVSD